MGILDRVRSTRDLDHSYFNMLVYGAPGTGKTYLARSAVEAGHSVLLLDADHGTMTLRDCAVPSLPISQYSDAVDVYTELLKGDHGYDTIFIDNLSEIQKMLVDQLKREHGRRFGLHSWAQIVDKTSALCRLYRSLPLNVVVLAHSMEIEDEDRVRVRPAISGKKLPHEIGGLFDMVGYSHTATDGRNTVAYRIGFATVGDRHITKDRSGKLGDVEDNDFGRLYRKVFPPQNGEATTSGILIPATSRPLATEATVREAAPKPTPAVIEDKPKDHNPAAQQPRSPKSVEAIVEQAEPSEASATPAGPPQHDGYGSDAWNEASRRFREVLTKISDGDTARFQAAVNYVKHTQKVGSSIEMTAKDLESWCSRLEFMAGAGDLDDYLEEHGV